MVVVARTETKEGHVSAENCPTFGRGQPEILIITKNRSDRRHIRQVGLRQVGKRYSEQPY